MTKYKRIPLETLVNVRDLGGFAAPGGKITKYGVFLRTDCPIGVSEKDIQFLKAYGIAQSIDLRSSDELKTTPSGMTGVTGHTYIHCPVSEGQTVLQNGETAGAPKTPPPPVEGNFDMGESYIDIAETAKPWAKRVFELCADCGSGVMYHCFIGKDRAGIITALLLAACGVCDIDIMMDYSASASCLRPKYNAMKLDFLPQKRGLPDYSWGFFGSVPESMEALLCHLKEKYGGVTGYLNTCGVSDETIEKLRNKLLEDAE